MIKAIAFDCGGVIISNAWDEGRDPAFHKVPQALGISIEEATEIFYRTWPEIKLGKASEGTFFRALLKVAKNKIPLEELRNLYHSCIYKKDAFEIVERLYEKYPDLPLYTLNNEGKEWMDVRIRKFNLRRYFKDFITSGYYGYAKPEREIYEILLEKAGVKAEEILFIDDKEKQLLPAREGGYKTILFFNKQQLEKELNNYGFNL